MMDERLGRVTRHGGTGANSRWPRWFACGLALVLVLQGFTVVAQRVIPGGHLHVVPVAHHGHDVDRHDHDHDSLRDWHFHAAVGHHEHATHDAGVVYVDDSTTSGIELSPVAKRVAFDVEQLAGAAVVPAIVVAGRAPPAASPRVPPSHVAHRLDRPPRLFFL